MRRARHALAVVLVATALCADRSVAAAPVPESPATPSQSESLAVRLVNRLSAGFRQAAPAFAVMFQSRGTVATPVRTVVAFARDFAAPAHQPISPFQFRLPPPTL